MSYNYHIKGEITISAKGIDALRKSPEAVVELLEDNGYSAEVNYEKSPANVRVYHLGRISEHDARTQITERIAKLSNIVLGHLEGNYMIIDENDKMIF